MYSTSVRTRMRIFPSSRPVCGVLVGLLLSLGPTDWPARAQPQPTLQAHAVEGTAAIDLDGRLDEQVWAHAPTSANFTQQEPVEGGTPSEETSVRVIYDHKALYIGVELTYRDPSMIRVNQLGRDGSLRSDDRLRWVLDPYNDRQNAYLFETNPLGLRGDGLLSTGQGSTLNKAWDGIWNVEVLQHERGWTAEIRIPFRTLQFDPDQTTWGFNVQRTLRVRNEEILWAGYERNQGLTRLRFAGELEGIRGTPSGLGLDVTPFGLAKGSRAWTDSEGSTQTTADAGVDLSYAFTPGLRTALTVNTDFAEVEVDERRVNLTRFPLRFPEKRDFFLESSGVFDFAPRSAQDPFFSRRIGLEGQTPIPILAGGRLNGRMGSYDVGLIQARTRETADVGPGDADLPPEDFTAGRIIRNLGTESQVGLIYTRRATHASSGPYAAFVNRHTVGTDLELGTTEFLGNQDLQFQAFFVWHNAPTDTSRSSWGQRTTRGLRLNYPNDPWVAHVSYREFGDAYDPAVGFVRRVGFRRLQPTVGYEPVFEDHSTIRQLGVTLRYEYLTDLAFNPETINITLTPLDLRFTTDDELEARLLYDFERLHEPFDILRDGRIIIPPGRYRTFGTEIEAGTAEYRTVSMDAEVEHGGFWSGTQTEFELGATVRPLRGVRAGVDWEHNRVRLHEGAFNTHVVRFDGNLDLTPDLSLRSQVQYDNLTEQLGFFGRLRWIVQPGSDLYIVYTQNWQGLDRSHLSPQNAEGAVKLTYTIRL